METLKDKERATIEDIAKTFNKLSEEQRKELVLIGYRMAMSNSKADGSRKNLN